MLSEVMPSEEAESGAQLSFSPTASIASSHVNEPSWISNPGVESSDDRSPANVQLQSHSDTKRESLE